MSKEKGGFWLNENGAKILFFQREINDSIPEYSRNNYFHPVYDLNGNCITEDFPEDHLHHRGIFWAWHQILVNGKSICDPWDIKNFTQHIGDIEFITSEKGTGVLSYTSFWLTKNEPENPFLKEETKVTVYPQTNNYRRIDFEISINALEHHLQLGGSADEKGYGGFTVRLKTDSSTIFTTDKLKKITPTNLAMPESRFIDISNIHKKSGVTIVWWPQNPGNENWILRQTRSAQNCAWPGRNPINLSVNEPITLKYTLFIHNGKLKNVPIKTLIKGFN